MHNVPKKLRVAIAEKFPLDELKVEEVQVSVDGTCKFLFKCVDDNLIESVLIPNNDGRTTVCISTQVGCPMQCSFCATGSQGFTRNLSTQEIIFQVAHMTAFKKIRVDNIVVMGQGEPFLNYENTLAAIKRLNHDESYKIASRKITVSTCGILEGIERFSAETEQFGLAISLHSAVQKTRDMLLPKTRNMPLNSLSEVLLHYQQVTNRRITFEYMLLDGINDADSDCEALIEFSKPHLCHVNLLHFNPVECCNFNPSKQERFKAFENALTSAGIACSVRKSKGSDVAGACGQLVSRSSF